ncbi:MAG: hypothetical protein K0R92_516 [Lachnospiraceae bacterium]|jgi:hypothetical protein|nr:hypothetical protein [Lachnospiraceae bacterium]
MYELAASGLSAQQVIKALQSNREIKYEYDLLNKEDKKIGALSEVEGSYSFNSEAVIKGTGRFILNEKEYKNIDFLSERIKPYYCLKVGSEWIRWAQGIYLMNSPDRNEQDGGIYRNIEAYDKSIILKEDKVDTRYFIAAGTIYTDAVRDLILSSGINKISIQESSLVLTVDKEYEIGTSKLDIINNLLNSINYNSVWFDNNGFCVVRKYINPKERSYEFVYKTDNNSITTYGSSETIDAFSIPNKFIRYVENPETDYMISIFINDKASNPLSTVSRGRTITDIEAINDIPDQATLDDYVKRIANEKSKVIGGIKFNTLPMPHHSFLDCLYIKNTTLDISEKFIETAWSINTSVNGLMSHTCRKVVELW